MSNQELYEIAKPREATYEKPKRLTNDGEIEDADEWVYEEAERALKS
jgi:hypothetical protein